MADELMQKIQAAIATSQSGRRDLAITEFAALLPLLGNDALYHCIFGHFMADLQEDPAEELFWDLQSLHYLHVLSNDRLKEFHPSLNKSGFYASVYLNIADGYRRNNDVIRAKEYLVLADEAVQFLPSDGYGRMIAAGIARLRESLFPK